MKVDIAEIALAGCLCAVAASGLLAFAALRGLRDAMPLAEGMGPEPLLLAALAVQAASCAFGVLVVLPLVRRLKREQGQLRFLTGELSQRSLHFEQAALTDALTGVSNRRYFDETLSQFLAEFGRIERPVGLMILDLDHFKSINDNHGHDVGDAVLKAVAQCLVRFSRHHDVVARLGGEEFAVIVPNMSAPALEFFADRIREAISKIVVCRGNIRLRVTVSIGLAVAGPGEEPAGVCKRADVMLYRAKQGGRNRVCA